jgi:phage-related protein
VATDDVTLRFDGEDSELSAILDRIQSRLSTVEDRLDKLNIAGRAAGDGVEAGMDKAAKATDKAGRAAESASPKIARAGDSAASSGAKAAAGSKGFDDFAGKVEKANKSTGGFGSITKLFKFGSIATGIYALAGAISAAGAASIIGIAHLAPLLLNLLNFAPAALAAAASMAVFKLTATQLAGPLGEIKSEFSGLGDEIAKGGLLTGVSTLANDLKPLSKVTGGGLTAIGAQLGFAAGQLGSFAQKASTLSTVQDIFNGLDPIVHDFLQGLLSLLPGALALIKAIEPATQAMAYTFKLLAGEVSAWAQAESASGNITTMMTNAFSKLWDAGKAVWNVIVALFNIFKIAGSVTAGFGGSIDDLTAKFRAWTQSTSGQASITKYFVDAMPAIRQVEILIGNVFHLLGGLASGSNLAPLLGQINTQLIPALATLIGHLADLGGLGPSIITVVSNLAKLAGGLSFSAFTTFASALAGFSNWLVWAQANIPGFNQLLSTMLGLFLAFKIIAPIIIAINNAMKLMTAIGVVAAAVSSGLETMGIIGLFALDGLAVAADFAAGAIDAAFVATPIGWIVLAIIAVIAIIVVLWEKCAWFRDAVEAVWNAIKIAAVAVWDFIKAAAVAVWDFIAAYIRAWVVIVTGIWRGIVAAAQAIWQGLVVAWQAVWSVLEPIVSIVWTVIKFIIQVVVYIIVGLITLIALAAQGVWWLIKAGAEWLWNTILHPIFSLIATVAIMVWQGLVTIATVAWNLISAAALWFWNTILHPIFIVISAVAQWLWGGIVTAAQWCWNMISAAAGWLWNTILHPIFIIIATVGATIWSGIVTAATDAWGLIKGVWSVISGWFKTLWDGISGAAKGAWSGISDAISAVGKVVSGVWNTIVGAVKAVWNFIAKGWNSIPNITVPSWVPFIGGKSFGLPKLPILYAGGPTPGGPALVGEHGPELLVRGGQVRGVLGANGPEIVPNLPRGGYVVPNSATIAAGMAKKIPMPVSAAISRTESSGTGNRELMAAVRELSAALRDRPPALAVSGGENTHKAVLSALREHDREQNAKNRYKYKAGQS